MTNEELEKIEIMADHFLKQEPSGPYWNILKILICEIHKLKSEIEDLKNG